MSGFSFFRAPETIIYGRSSFEKVGSEAAFRGKKALIICDKIMEDLGNTASCKNYLQKEGVKSCVFAGVNFEPTDEYVSHALRIFQEESCNLVISLGGGSCIDTAKAVPALVTNGGYIGEYMGGKKMATEKPIAHIAVPTTAGTGSEATDVTVIINASNDEKMMIKQPAFMPAVAIVDSELTVSSPKGVTAATGVDALTHAISAYLSRKAHPLTDTLALSAMKLIVANIRQAYTNGNDLEARDAMSLGSLQAGMAFTNASVALVHGMSRPIGALFHVPHGISNAMLLPAVLEFSKENCIARLANLGRFFSDGLTFDSDDETADFAIAEVRRLCNDLNIPNLKNYGIDRVKFDSVIGKMSFDALKSGSPANNPRVPTQEEIEALYRVCYNYKFSDS
jgi:alcohol dehydrogenase class IV